MQLTARIATLELTETFVISRDSRDTVDVVQVEIRHAGVSGFGEGVPVDYHGEPAQAEAGGAGWARRRAGSRGARHDGGPASGRRQRVLDPRGGARRAATAR